MRVYILLYEEALGGLFLELGSQFTMEELHDPPRINVRSTSTVLHRLLLFFMTIRTFSREKIFPRKFLSIRYLLCHLFFLSIELQRSVRVGKVVSMIGTTMACNIC